ncbi:glycosyltransferase [Desulfovibrio inopinatus]|uniref:glycosyltransferase n=1 Tax=Desulfovibrio inopinatus TaxID=102109 RepID=UPI0003F743D0|nr:hypothetical protein [Desulfovibrio inopinatus]
MRIFFFLPPLRKMTGGLYVLGTIADALAKQGFNVFFVPRDEHNIPAFEGETKAISHIPLNLLQLTSDDVWIVPEGWPNALAPGLTAKARCVVYCQNWAYLFSGLPEHVNLRSLPVSFIAVSNPVALYIQQTLGSIAPILRPGIDRSLFRAPDAKPGGVVRIAYMPRKNKAQVEQIRSAVMAMHTGHQADRPQIHFIPIADMDKSGVARVLQSAHIFLATGFPEGCPLPPLEAMACGCIPVGFAGFGGFDYMRQAIPDAPGAFDPWWNLPSLDWGGNSFIAADNDVLGAACLLDRAVELLHSNKLFWETIVEHAQATAQAYDMDAHRHNAVAVIGGMAT